MSTRDNTFINIEDRIIYLHDYVDADSIAKINYWLLDILRKDDKLENESKSFTRQPIKFYINSNGGNVDDMWSLVTIMLKSKTPIYTYCTSYAHSCGLLIFLAGSKRFISDFSYMLLHQLSFGKSGKLQHVDEYVDVVKIYNQYMINYITSRCNISKEKVEEVFKCQQDYYMFTDELLELNVATDIIEEF